MSVQISYKKQLALGIMLVLLIIGVIEGIVRTYDYINPQCDFVNNDASKGLDYHVKKQICENWETRILYIDPVTGMLALEPNQHNSIMNINKHGFRGPEISKEKPDNIYRIFIVGGSTTLSLRALSDQHTIPGYLQEDFNQLDYNKKIEVINAGMAAYTSAGELQLIKTKIIDFHPDMIIIYDGANDIHTNPNRILTEKYYDLTSLQEIYLRYFTFYKTPKIIGEVISEKDPFITQPRTYAVAQSQIRADDWMNNIQKICDLGQSSDFKTIIVLQPFLGTGNKLLTEHEKKSYEFWDMKNMVPAYHLFADNLGKLNGTCTSTMDLRNVFDDISESVYFDRAHIIDHGNQIIAEKIFDLTLPLVLEKGVSLPTKSKPNIILIMTDDLDLNSFNLLLNNGLLPNIKGSLVNKGITLTNAFVTTPNCCPSRATLFTGLYAHNHEVFTNRPPNGSVTAFNDSETLPVWLSNSGYRTGLIGKYLNFYGIEIPYSYIPPGWDDWKASIDPSTYYMYDYQISDNGNLVEYGNKTSDYQTDVFAQLASNFISDSENNDPVPFFLMVSIVAPHNEQIEKQKVCHFKIIRPPERYIDTVDTLVFFSESFNEDDTSDKPPWLQNNPLLTDTQIECLKKYKQNRLEAIRAIDDLVGEIVNSLKINDELKNTVIIFTSDNGYLLGEHRVTGKGYPYEETVRVPLIISAPNSKIPQQVNELVTNVDLSPSILELAGSSANMIMDGRSLIPLLDKSLSDQWREMFLIEYWSVNPSFPSYYGIRDINYLYVEYEDGYREFYNLKNDPYQLKNQINCKSSNCLKIIDELSQKLLELKKCTSGTCQIIENS